LAAAAAKGLYPKSVPFTAGLTLLLTAGVAFALKGHLLAAACDIVGGGITAAVRRHQTVTQLASQILAAAWPFAVLVTTPFFGILATQLMPLFIFPRGRGRTSIPIPKPRPPLAEIASVRLAGAALFGLASRHLLRGATGQAVSFADLLSALMGEGLRLVTLLGGVLLAVGIHEISAKRRAIFQALRLNRSEAAREDRTNRGDGILRRQRRHRIQEGA
jgi:flagellar biosynthesis protein FlhB